MTPTETKELLTYAAKAAGIETDGWYEDDLSCGLIIDRPYCWVWNPTTDRGDRLRLARACRMIIDFDAGTVLFPLGKKWSDHTFTPGNDEQEALAIVRAAAAIGREM